MEAFHDGRQQPADELRFALLMYEQALAEPAPGKNVDMLLERDLMVASQSAQQRRGGGVHVFRQHGEEIRFAKISEAELLGGAHEFGEAARLVAVLQEFVAYVGIACFLELRRLSAENAAPRALRRGVLLQEGEQLARLRDPRPQRPLGRDVQRQRVAERLPQSPSRQHIVADVSDAGRGEIVARDAQNRLAHRRRHPAVDAVANDVVEGSVLRAQLRQALAAKTDVGKLQRRDSPQAIVDLALREIDPEKTGAREARSERDQIAAGGAAELEHPRGANGRRLESKEARRRGEPSGMRLRERMRFVGEVVVGGGVAGDRALHRGGEQLGHL